MKRFFVFVMGCLLLFVNCSEDTSSQSKALEQLNNLYKEGYNVSELALRIGCTEKDVVDILQLKEEIDNPLCEAIDSIYKLNEDENIIPIYKLGKSASECLWKLYTKAQNLPLTSQYTNVGVSAVGNALTKRRALNYEDSIKVLVAYINDMNELDTIPTHIDITPYYYNNNEGIGNIKIPRDYSLLYSGISDEQKLRLSYYIWQAEQFELKANANLEKSINSRITNYVSNSIAEFVNDDVDSYWNTIKCFFKDDTEEKEFYYSKFRKRFDEKQLQADIREEIESYCVSINCSRILAVNEVLGYNENVNNLSIAQKYALTKTMTRMEGLQTALNNKKAELGNETLVNAAMFVPLIISTGPGAAVAGATANSSTIILEKSFNISKSIFAYIGFDSLYKDIYKSITGEELDSSKAIEKMQKSMNIELNKKLKKQNNNPSGYKHLLDENTKQYYNNIRKDLGL